MPSSCPPLSELTTLMASQMEEPDQALTLFDPAEAGAAIERAIEDGALLYPPLESDSCGRSAALGQPGERSHASGRQRPVTG